ncbi:hypothetical protein ArsFIN_39880 [Arsenophonus nasoniae]|uniref:Phage transcriptional regulator n=1 Tax=Arsenophonus nasoniae TaxID=638 RepID=A0A4P7KU33_9GAMM|nr:hypothetical protein ArsFIN_20780 [Arsenophonus nasoniae]QBY44228.1 hypothetical protein ArsFIN_28050 [Arsenophonus nasoniae]QBY45390.1 hypothetical protein ArsFIN_39880 [Arsenophonus nasoniae]
MRIIIKNKNEVVWYRNIEKGEGMASKGYTKDGTQHEIISALEYALEQSRAELMCWNDRYRMSEGS